MNKNQESIHEYIFSKHSLKNISYHDAKFVITAESRGCCYDKLGWGATNKDKVGIMTTLSFQC